MSRDHDHRPQLSDGRRYSPAIAEFTTLAHAGVCPRCEGAGDIRVSRQTTNPFSGVGAWDPQEDDTVTCPKCNGTGAYTRRAAA